MGETTAEAMSSGIINSVAGGIERIITKVSDDHFNSNQLPVFITGGYAEQVIEALISSEIELVHKPNLVLEGVLLMLENYLNNK